MDLKEWCQKIGDRLIQLLCYAMESFGCFLNGGPCVVVQTTSCVGREREECVTKEQKINSFQAAQKVNFGDNPYKLIR